VVAAGCVVCAFKTASGVTVCALTNTIPQQIAKLAPAALATIRRIFLSTENDFICRLLIPTCHLRNAVEGSV
jgi:hypothetical protein